MMENAKPIKVCIAIVVMMVFSFSTVSSVFAETAFMGKDANNMPYTMEIPIKCTTKGSEKGKSGKTDSYVLVAMDKDNPMPKGSSNGRKKINVKSPGKSTFGEMTFDHPDVYKYKVYRVAKNTKGIKKDYSVYEVEMIALNDGKGSIVVHKKGQKKKSEIVYSDKIIKKKKRNIKDIIIPITGDGFNPIIFGMIMGFMIVILLAAIEARRRHKKYGTK